MKTIHLSDGTAVKVDDQDYEFLSQWKWRRVGSGYAGRTSRHGQIYMHRVLAGAIAKAEVDHKNGDKLDNRKHNLRLVTKTQNQRGYRRISNQSGVRGVNWYARINKWVVRITVGDKNLNIGYFNNLDEAAEARRQAELKYWK